MKFLLVLDLAADDTPVAVACWVLGFSKQAFYSWKAAPVTECGWTDAHLINAAVDVHRDDPAFGYRFIADELEHQGFSAGEIRVARLCSSQRIWSVFAKKRGLTRKAGLSGKLSRHVIWNASELRQHCGSRWSPVPHTIDPSHASRSSQRNRPQAPSPRTRPASPVSPAGHVRIIDAERGYVSSETDDQRKRLTRWPVGQPIKRSRGERH